MSKQHLEWPDVWDHLKMTKNKNNLKWVVTFETPKTVVEFLNNFGYETHNMSGPGFTSAQLSVLVLHSGFSSYIKVTDKKLAEACGVL